MSIPWETRQATTAFRLTVLWAVILASSAILVTTMLDRAPWWLFAIMGLAVLNVLIWGVRWRYLRRRLAGSY